METAGILLLILDAHRIADDLYVHCVDGENAALQVLFGYDVDVDGIEHILGYVVIGNLWAVDYSIGLSYQAVLLGTGSPGS